MWNVFISVIFFLLIFLIGRFLWTMALIVRQLEAIGDNETNQELKLSGRHPLFVRLTVGINQILRKEKTTRQLSKQTQQQFDQAIHNIAHDVRTPLTVAHGYTQHLREQQHSLSVEDSREILDKISRNLFAVEERVENLLTYNRLIEKQTQEILTFTELDVSRLIQAELLKFYPSFSEKEMALSVQLASGLKAITVEDHLKRIFQNMMGNMLEHGVKKGEILLTAIEHRVIIQTENQMAQEISSPQRLFDRFYTEDLAREKKNAGLGLFIIQELTEDLGGEVELTCEGHTFLLRVHIPLKGPSQKE